MEIVRLKAFDLPQGACIRVGVSSGNVGAHEEDSGAWKSLDVTLVHGDGFQELLCAVDYEPEIGLRVLLYDEQADEPTVCREIKGFRSRDDKE